MPLEDLTPSNRFELALSGDMTADEASNRIEKILAGADIEPADRLEYFMKLRVSQGGGGGGEAEGLLSNTLTSFESDTLTDIATYALYKLSNLTSFKAHNVRTIGAQAFDSCGVTALAFPKLGYNLWQIFKNAKALTVCDLETSSTLMSDTFNGCTSLSALVLRKPTIITLNNINVFSGTPFASNGTGGTLYVPQALISTYQAANNWSTILGYENNQIKAIEGSIYENAYADGTPIS